MNRWGIVLLSVLVLFVFGVCVHAQETAPSPLVKTITVEGNAHISTFDILSQVKSKLNEPYSKYKIRDDIKHIYDMGYFKEVAVDETQEKDGIKVTFFVKENPVVKDILFDGNKVYKSKRLKNELKFNEGKVYQEGLLQSYIDKIKALYKEKQYIIDVQGKMETVNEDQVNLKFNIIEENRAKIKEIEFTGNHAIRSKVLIKTMKTKRSWLVFSHFFDPLVYEEDQKRIEDAFKNKGYVLVKVTMHDPELIPGTKGVRLKIDIEEGDQYKIGKVDIQGNTLFSSKEVHDAVLSKASTVYNQSQVEKDSERIYSLYGNQGYVLTDVNNMLSLDTEKRLVNINFQIDESHRMTLGKIKLKGVAIAKDTIVKSGKGYDEIPLKTKDKVIKRELTLEPGDVLRRDEMVRSQQRLMNLGYFDGVDLRYEPTNSADTLDLVLYLAEKQTGTIQFGVGYSTEKKAEVFVDLSEINLFGSGKNVRFKADLAQEGSEYDLTYTDPYFLDTRVSMQVEIFRDVLSRTIDSNQYSLNSSNGLITLGDSTSHDYDEIQTGASVTLSYPFDANLRASLQLTHKRVQLKASDSGYVLPAPLGPTNSVTNSITPGITYDSRDNVYWPTRGVRYQFTTELAGLGGDNNYVKLYGEGNWYKKFGSRFIAAVRVRGGYILPYSGTDDAPLSDRFFLGGSNTLRGYNFRGVSPTLSYLDTTNSEEVDLVVGGDLMLNTNMELRTKFTERLIGVLFFDSGGVWRKIDDFDPSQIRFGVGPGIVLNLPIGYFQVGYGFPFNAQPGDNKQGPYFTFGSTF